MNDMIFRSNMLPQFTVGFDRLQKTLEDFTNTKMSTYPPYNIIKFDDDNYYIELAIAGFNDSDEFVVTVKDNVLTVVGSKVNTSDVNYLYQGIAFRDFKREFTLASTVEVVSAKLKDGILRIHLKNVIPDHMKPRTIPVISD